MIRRRLLAAVVWASAVTALAAVDLRSPADAGQGQAQSPVFRGGVELISVEVAVVNNRDGRPVTDVPAEAFDVTLDGRKRRVVSATFVSHATSVSAGDPNAAAPVLPDGIPPRVFLIAIDVTSVGISQGKATIDAAAGFVRRAGPTDLVGLFTYPNGPKVDPTTNRAAVINALWNVHPQADTTPPGEFNLSATDLVELARDPMGASSAEAQKLRSQLCPPEQDGGADLSCLARLDSEIKMSVMYSEGMAQASIGMLDNLMRQLAPVPGRKTLVLISGGIVSSDMPGGRPDNHVLGSMAGRTAAESNVNVYTLYVDQVWSSIGLAETRRARSGLTNRERESQLRAKWLNEFSGAAGGTVVKVLAGGGEFGFDRIVQETSAYYVLGVEPASADRDGRLHEVRVKARGQDLTVRGKSWVKLPKPGNIATARAPATVPAAGRPASPAPPEPARPLDPQVRELAELFDRGDRSGFAERARANTAGQIMANFRTGPSPWPEAPQRAAVFALDLAISALHGGSRFAQEEALRLLVDYSVRIRGAAAEDPFECTWLRTEVAGLESLFAPELTSRMVEVARDRCPADPHLRLAVAVAAEQQHFRLHGTLSPSPGPVKGDLDPESRRVFELFEVAKADETRYEATIRQAWLLHRVGRTADGLARITGLSEPDDPYLVYLGRLLRGQMLSELNDPAAVQVLQSAASAWPASQAALVALMAAHVGRGNLDDAALLAERIQTMPATSVLDPWWTYWLGDVRFYVSRLEGLKGRAR